MSRNLLLRWSSISAASKMLTNPVSGYSRSFWSAWLAAFRSLPSRNPNWRCFQGVMGQKEPQPGSGVLTMSHSVHRTTLRVEIVVCLRALHSFPVKSQGFPVTAIFSVRAAFVKAEVQHVTAHSVWTYNRLSPDKSPYRRSGIAGSALVR
jgi:hypothetical protein